jgi:polar amino acid transport system substrate-binding protein
MKTFLTVLAAVIIAVIATHYMPHLSARDDVTVPPVVAQSAYQDVLQKGVLRCGYFEEAPFLMKDPNTGKMSGIAVELTETIGKELGLKIDWVSEINFGTFPQDLANRRFDAVCADVFTLPRAGKVDYTTPFALVPVYGYVRSGDARFDGDLMTHDWSSTKVAALDGEGATTAAMKLLPKAQFVRLPQSSQIAEMLQSVAQGKADIAFVMPSVFAEFAKTNPNVLQQVQSTAPLYTFGVGMALKPEEPGLKNMLDNTIRQLVTSGELNRIIDTYDPTRFFKRIEH